MTEIPDAARAILEGDALERAVAEAQTSAPVIVTLHLDGVVECVAIEPRLDLGHRRRDHGAGDGGRERGGLDQ